ncbi:MAG: response regulator, partial [Arenibacterium sp.]
VEVSTISALPEALNASYFDVIFIDFVLPKGDGLQALELVREHYKNNRCATIMLTGDDCSDVAVKSLRNGCTDYVFKGNLTSGSLRERIIRAIEIEAVQSADAELARYDGAQLGEASMREYTNLLQTKLAHIIGDLRAILAEESQDREQVSEKLKGVEHRCMQLWAILLDPAINSGGKRVTH